MISKAKVLDKLATVSAFLLLILSFTVFSWAGHKERAHLAPSSLLSREDQLRYETIQASIEMVEESGENLSRRLHSDLLEFFTYLTAAKRALQDSGISAVLRELELVRERESPRYGDPRRTTLERELIRLIHEKIGLDVETLSDRWGKGYRSAFLYQKNFGLSDEMLNFAGIFVTSENPQQNTAAFLRAVEGMDELRTDTVQEQQATLKRILARLIFLTTYRDQTIQLRSGFRKIPLPEQVERFFWSACEKLEIPLSDLQLEDIESRLTESVGYSGSARAVFEQGAIEVYKSPSRLWVHLVCSLLDEFFQGAGFSTSHIPKVLGFKGEHYFYQYARGGEGLEEYLMEDPSGTFHYYPNSLHDGEALAFLNSLFGFSSDFADAEGPGSKNIIIDSSRRGNKGIESDIPSPRTWKLIDFETRSGQYRQMLPEFMARHAADLRRVLGEARYELLLLAVHNLIELTPHHRKFRFQKLMQLYQRGMIAEIFEEQKLASTKILVNGVGVVGRNIADALTALGYNVFVYDPDTAKAKSCSDEFNCTVLENNDVESLQREHFDVIIDASPAGQGRMNKAAVYDRLPDQPKIIFQGGEAEDIASPYLSASGNIFPQEPITKISNCNYSAMAILFAPLLDRFGDLEVTNHYQRSADFESAPAQYEPYHHDRFKELIAQILPRSKGKIRSLTSFYKAGNVPGYHLHQAILKNEDSAFGVEEVKEALRLSDNSYRIFLVDERLTEGLPFQTIMHALSHDQRARAKPIVVVRVRQTREGVEMEYAVPHRVNVVTDTVAAVFGMTGNQNSLFLARYRKWIEKNKPGFESALYRSGIYKPPVAESLGQPRPLPEPMGGPSSSRLFERAA